MQSLSRTPGKTLQLKEQATVSFPPGELQFQDAHADAVREKMLKAMTTIGQLSKPAKEKEVNANPMKTVHEQIAIAAGVKYACANNRTTGVNSWKGGDAPDTGFKFPANNLPEEKFNPDYGFYTEKNSFHEWNAVIDAKREKTFDQNDKGKIVSDAGYLARLSLHPSMPFILWHPTKTLMGEVFIGSTEADDFVLFFDEWDPSESESTMCRFLRILHHAAKFGTLLPQAMQEQPSTYKFLGRGATSLVFELSNPVMQDDLQWRVLKLVVGKLHHEVAEHEVAQLKKIHKWLDTTNVPKEQRHFFRACLQETTENYSIILFDKLGTPLSHNAFADRDFALQAFDALDDMHDAGVIHNDIRVSNLYTVDSLLVFGDFGYSLIRGKETTWMAGSLMTAHIDVRTAALSKKSYVPSVQHDIFSVVALCRMAQCSSGSADLVRLAACQAQWKSKPEECCNAVQVFWKWQLHTVPWLKLATAKTTEDCRKHLGAALQLTATVYANTLSLEQIEEYAAKFARMEI